MQEGIYCSPAWMKIEGRKMKNDIEVRSKSFIETSNYIKPQ